MKVLQRLMSCKSQKEEPAADLGIYVYIFHTFVPGTPDVALSVEA